MTPRVQGGLEQPSLADRLAPFARSLSESELRSPRHWPTNALVDWSLAHCPEVSAVELFVALGIANARELQRREALAIHAGVLVEGRWPLAFDVSLRETEEESRA